MQGQRRRRRPDHRQRRRQRGQTMPEYVILASFVIMAIAAIFGAFPAVLNNFCVFVLHVVCGPL
jgi:hypothetical protein